MKCSVWKVWDLPESNLEFASARVPLMVCFRAGYRAKSIHIFLELNNLEKTCSFRSLMLDIPSFPPQAISPYFLSDTFPAVHSMCPLLPSNSIAFCLTGHTLHRSYKNSLVSSVLQLLHVIKGCCQVSSASSRKEIENLPPRVIFIPGHVLVAF